jgi:hypothetical protein
VFVTEQNNPINERQTPPLKQKGDLKDSLADIFGTFRAGYSLCRCFDVSVEHFGVMQETVVTMRKGLNRVSRRKRTLDHYEGIYLLE